MKFIRKNGRIIPIREPDAVYGKGGAKIASKSSPGMKIAKGLAAAGSGLLIAQGARNIHAVKAVQKKEGGFKSHAGLDALGLAAAVASGVVGAATFTSSARGFIGGLGASFALDAVSSGANVASVSRGLSGHTKKQEVKRRALQGLKQEARNVVVGNAVFAAGILATPAGRARIMSGVSKLGSLARKVLKLA